MLSGSRFGVGEPEARARELQRRHRRRRSTRRPRARAMPLPGRVLNTPELAAEADMLVVNGGFSAVSEAFVMRKPLIVIPVPNHAEQWVNARTVCELGVGMMAHDQDRRRAHPGLARIESSAAAYARLPNAPDGAEQAAGVSSKQWRPTS